MKRCLVLVLVLIMMGVPAMAECVLDSDWTDRTFVLGDTGYTLVLPEGVEPTEPDEESGRAYAVNESFENSEGGFAVYVGFYPGEEFDAYYEASRKEAIESFAETEWIVLENPDSLMWQMSAASGQPYVRLIDGMSRVFPEEVRYILYCDKHGEFAGTYSNGGGVGEIILADIQIFDRESGQVIAAQEFRGGNPPYQVKSGGVHYGSEPDKAAIESWILSSIRDNATAAVTEVTVYAQVPNGWYGPGCWVWSSEGVDAFDAWPGESMTLQGDWYASTVPAWIDYVIINANDGTSQTADLPVTAGKDVWVIVNEYGEAQVFYENPLN